MLLGVDDIAYGVRTSHRKDFEEIRRVYGSFHDDYRQFQIVPRVCWSYF
jgi:hypothetical protein